MLSYQVIEHGKPLQKVFTSPPRPKGTEVLVRITRSGVCHSDLHIWDGYFDLGGGKRFYVKERGCIPPFTLGHEPFGVVEAIGSKVSKLKVGDHVVMSFDSCGHCRNCEKDNPAYCFEFFPRNFAGARIADGSTAIAQNGAAIHSVFFSQSSFATYAIAREMNAVSIAKDLPLDIMGPLGCGIQTG